MPRIIAAPIAMAGAAALLLCTVAASGQTSMTSQSAQAALQRHADAGRIVIQNGARDGSWFMERRATGIVAAAACSTDFAAPQATRLVNVSDPANHYYIIWSELQNIRLDGDAVSFKAPHVAPDGFARLVVRDAAARAEVFRAMQTLARNCGVATATATRPPVPTTSPQVRPPAKNAGQPAPNGKPPAAAAPLPPPGRNDTGGTFRLRDGSTFSIPATLRNWKGVRRSNNGEWDGYFYLELRGSEPWIRVELELLTAEYQGRMRTFQEKMNQYRSEKNLRRFEETFRTKTGSIKMDCFTFSPTFPESKVVRCAYGSPHYSIFLAGSAAKAGDNSGLPQIRSFLAETSFR